MRQAGVISEEGIIFCASIPGLFVEEVRRSQNFSMVRRHFHESLELYVLLEGERFYFIDQDTYHIRQGMAVLINRSQIHKTSMVGNNSAHRRFLLQIEPRRFEGFLKLLGFPNDTALGDQYWGISEFTETSWLRCLALLDGIKGELQSTSAQSQHLIYLRTLELLMLFCQSRADSSSKQWRENQNTRLVNTGMYEKVHEIALYLQNNSYASVSLTELAGMFYISKSYLTRIFKSVTGFTVTEYQTFCRVKKAQFLLADTELSITEISEQTGFGNVTYFERVFLKATEMTPMKYRKRFRP